LICFLAALFGPISPLIGADEQEKTPIEFHGPAGRPGFPNPFSIGYLLRKSTLSPDKQYGVIFPKILLESESDFIVNVKTSAILAAVQVNNGVTPYFEGQNRGGLTVTWSPDSTAMLVEIDERWHPGALVVIELKEGTVYRQTDLSEQVDKLFSPAAAKHTRSKDAEVDTYDVTATTWKATPEGLQLQLKCEGQTNPKAFSDHSTWEGTFEAVWDLGQHKFIEHQVVQTGFTPADKEDE